jgi:hypothetical protein
MLNFRLMSHWQNWATILLMLLIASFAVNSLSKVLIMEEQK